MKIKTISGIAALFFLSILFTNCWFHDSLFSAIYYNAVEIEEGLWYQATIDKTPVYASYLLATESKTYYLFFENLAETEEEEPGVAVSVTSPLPSELEESSEVLLSLSGQTYPSPLVFAVPEGEPEVIILFSRLEEESGKRRGDRTFRFKVTSNPIYERLR